MIFIFYFFYKRRKQRKKRFERYKYALLIQKIRKCSEIIKVISHER